MSAKLVLRETLETHQAISVLWEHHGGGALNQDIEGGREVALRADLRNGGFLRFRSLATALFSAS